MSIYIGRWDCPVCGLKGNAGPDTHCAGCASPRSNKVQFYLPENPEEVTAADRLKQAKAGANWQCNYCGAENVASATHCHSCGNERDQKDTARQERVIYDDQPPAPEPAPKRRAVAPPPKKSAPFKYGFLVFLLVFALGIWYLFKPNKFEVEVAGREWVRTVDIEHYQPFIEQAWELPSGARLISRRQEVHHYDQVLDGYDTRTRTVRVQTGTRRKKCGKRDLGNGYFEDQYCDEPVYKNKRETYQEPRYRSVPVYGTKYKYEIFRWEKDRTLTAKGSDLTPKFPSEPLPSQDWREGKRTETYTLQLMDKNGKPYSEKVNFAFWQAHPNGAKLKAKHNTMGTYYGLDEVGAKP
jgi:Zn-finger in Ran binding protein and others